MDRRKEEFILKDEDQKMKLNFQLVVGLYENLNETNKEWWIKADKFARELCSIWSMKKL